MGPLRLVNPIAKVFGAKFSDEANGFIRPCDGDNIPNLAFTFGEATILMKPEDLFTELEVFKSYKFRNFYISSKMMNILSLFLFLEWMRYWHKRFK